MQLPSSPRRSTIPSPEQQAAADRAEQLHIAGVARWRMSWLPCFLAIIAVADAAGRRDLELLQYHLDRLQMAVVDLWFEREKQAARGRR